MKQTSSIVDNKEIDVYALGCELHRKYLEFEKVHPSSASWLSYSEGHKVAQQSTFVKEIKFEELWKEEVQQLSYNGVSISEINGFKNGFVSGYKTSQQLVSNEEVDLEELAKNAAKIGTPFSTNEQGSVYMFKEGYKAFEQFSFNNIKDLRIYLLKHPDQEMVRSSCLHYLGDKAQQDADDEEIEEICRKLCDLKAEENNTIDLNAYGIGVIDGYKEAQQDDSSVEEIFHNIDNKKLRYSTEESAEWSAYKLGVMDALEYLKALQQDKMNSEKLVWAFEKGYLQSSIDYLENLDTIKVNNLKTLDKASKEFIQSLSKK